MADERLKIIIDALNLASDDLKELQQDLGAVDAESEEAEGGISEFTDYLMGPFGAAVGGVAVTAIAKMGAELVMLGVESNRAEQALISYTGGAMQAEMWTRAMGDAAQGALSEMELMQAGAKFAAGGLADTAEEAAHLTDIAITLGASVGKGPTESIEELGLLLQNQSKLRLDEFGVSGSAVTERMGELKESVEGVTTEGAFMTAFYEIAEEKLDLLNETGFDAVSAIDQQTASWENQKLALGRLLSEGTLPLLESHVAQTNVVRDLAAETALTTGTYEEFVQVMWEAGHAGEFTTQEFWSLERQMNALEVGAKTTSPEIINYGNAVGTVGKDAGEAAGNLDSMRLQIVGLAEADLGRVALQELNKEFDPNVHDLDDYKEKAGNIMENLLGMEQPAINAQLAIMEARQEFAQTEELDDYDKVLGGILTKYLALSSLGSDGVIILPDVQFGNINAPSVGSGLTYEGGGSGASSDASAGTGYSGGGIQP